MATSMKRAYRRRTLDRSVSEEKFARFVYPSLIKICVQDTGRVC